MTDDQYSVLKALYDERAAITSVLNADSIAFELATEFPRETASLVNIAMPLLNDANTAWREALDARMTELDGLIEAITVTDLPTS